MKDTTSSITMQSLGKIAQCVLAVTAKMWCFYRQDCRVASNCRYCFSDRPKIRFFATQGRLVTPIQVKLCRTDGNLGLLGCAKFHVNLCWGLGMRPQNIRKFHFLVKTRPAGATPLTDFKNFRSFYTYNYPTLAFQISRDLHHRLRSYCGETARR